MLSSHDLTSERKEANDSHLRGREGRNLIKKWRGPETLAVTRWTQAPYSPNAQMVYIASWQDFQEAAENLYEKSPNTVSSTAILSFLAVLINHWKQTRYCVKWKSSEANLVLKVTDNTTVSPPPCARRGEEND